MHLGAAVEKRESPCQNRNTKTTSTIEVYMSTASAEEFWTILEHLADVLSHLHSRGLIHGDVKPDNIMQPTKDHETKLLDLGHACENDDEDAKTQPSGTPCYLPPEFLIGSCGKPRDIWALGVVALFLGRFIPLPCETWLLRDARTKPSVQTKMRSWLQKIEKTRRLLPADLALVKRMLDPNPSQRITSQSLVHELQVLRRPSSRILRSALAQ